MIPVIGCKFAGPINIGWLLYCCVVSVSSCRTNDDVLFGPYPSCSGLMYPDANCEVSFELYCC